MNAVHLSCLQVSSNKVTLIVSYNLGYEYPANAATAYSANQYY